MLEVKEAHAKPADKIIAEGVQAVKKATVTKAGEVKEVKKAADPKEALADKAKNIGK